MGAGRDPRPAARQPTRRLHGSDRHAGAPDRDGAPADDRAHRRAGDRHPGPGHAGPAAAPPVAPTVASAPVPPPSPTAPAAASPIAPAASQRSSERRLECGAVVRESVKLANDLVCSKDGLTVDADEVTLDLGGHTLRGP